MMRIILLMMMMLGRTASSSVLLINCGSNSTSVNIHGRNWVSDTMIMSPNPTFTISSSTPAIAITAVNYSGDSTLAPLFKTARFFTDSLNYTFSLTQGNYFLRLYFYPCYSFENRNANESSFTVMANGLKLVDKFNVLNEIQTKNMYLLGLGRNSSSLSSIKEYFLDVHTNLLLVEFIPEKGSFGFLNAIEIVPGEGTLFEDSVSIVGGGNGVNSNLNLSKRGVETMYRLNVGGSSIQPNKDPDLWRMWESDSSYMFIADAGSEISNSSNITYASVNDTLVAPLLVYETARTMFETEVLEKRFNMSWKFKVDSGFDYLIRLHFCELIFEKANQRLFRIFINNRTAVDNFDVFVRAGGMNKAYHHDFLDVLSTKTETLWIQLGPDTAASASGTDAFLNGLEIFKLSRNGNLARIGPTKTDYPGSEKSKGQRFWVDIGAGVTSIAIFGVMFTLAFYLCRNKGGATSKKDAAGWRALSQHGAMVNNIKTGSVKAGNQTLQGCMSSARVGKRFLLSEIRLATNNFDEKLLIGVGGFGKVYKGKMEEDLIVAIKRAHPQSEQGLAEFETEIGMLSKLRHRHLVSMIGFCEEQNEMILVYEYMANGTLRSHLFGSDLPHLPWKQRLEVCIGAARGLHYLHTGADQGIIHRDIKTTNILLDDNFVAKMADFGLSKTAPSLEHTHVSTAVKGSFGYLDPEYFRRQQLTEKSDVYSFGVVLFEVVCARAVINPSLPRDEINLAEWAMRWQRERSLETIIDPHLIGNYCPESLKKYGEIAEKCIGDEGRKRPSMGEVLWHLEYVLQLHEAWMRNKEARSNSFSSGQILMLP